MIATPPTPSAPTVDRAAAPPPARMTVQSEPGPCSEPGRMVNSARGRNPGEPERHARPSRRHPAPHRRPRPQAAPRRHRSPRGCGSAAQDSDLPPAGRGRTGPHRSDHRSDPPGDRHRVPRRRRRAGTVARGGRRRPGRARALRAGTSQGDHRRVGPAQLRPARPQSRTLGADRGGQRRLRAGLRRTVRPRHGRRPAVRHAGGLREPRQAHLRVPLAPPLRRHGVRAGGPAGEQAPPRHGLRASALERQALHGLRHHSRSGRRTPSRWPASCSANGSSTSTA